VNAPVPTLFDQLLTQVEQMLAESADPEISRAFDARAWLEDWLVTRHQALGGRAPASMLSTAVGFDLVRRLLLAQQTGAYW
jgi:hypothetical protein